MKTQEVVLSSGSTSIKVRASSNILRDILASDFLAKYIPALSLAEDKANLTLELTDDDTLSFVFNPPQARLSFNSSHKVSTREIIAVIDYCLDWVRQSNGVYNIHSSACSYHQQGVVFFGSVSGLGKTTLAANLCLQNNFGFVGDEKVLINEDGLILGGATTLEFNKPALLSTVGAHLNNHDAATEQILRLASLPVKAGLIVQPIVVPGGELSVEPWSPEQSEWHIYEEMTRKIRGVSRRISHFSYPLPSIDDAVTSQRRVNAARQLAQTIPFYTIRGDIKPVMNAVAKLLIKVKGDEA